MDKRPERDDDENESGGGEEEEEDEDEEDDEEEDDTQTRVEEWIRTRTKTERTTTQGRKDAREESEIGRFRVHGTSGGDISRD